MLSGFARRTLLRVVLGCTLLAHTAEAQFPVFGGKPKRLTAELISEQTTVAPGKPFQVLVKLVVEPGWHTYGKTVPENVTGKPTALIWTLPEGWKSEDLSWPPTRETPSADGKVPAYTDTVYLPTKLTPPANLAPGGTAKISVVVDAVVCDLQNCVPLRDLKASLELKTGAESVADTTHADLFKAVASKASAAPTAAPAEPVAPALKTKKLTATLVSEQSTVAPGQPFRMAVKLEVAPHWHTYGKTLPPEIDGAPTTLAWDLPHDWTMEELPWPPTKDTPSAGNKVVPAYEGTVYLPVLITPPAAISPGTNARIGVTVDAVACDLQNCVPFRELKASLELKTGASPVADASQAQVFEKLPKAPVATTSPSKTVPQGSIAWFLLLGFLGGLILNIMPCVFPVLALKVTSVVSQAQDDRGKVLIHGIAYTLGVFVTFWALDGVLIFLREAGHSQGWGFQFQSPWFNFVVVLIMMIFGLNMAGLFEVGVSATSAGSELTSKSGYAGSFFSGLFATVVATPCTAPLLANALPVALSLPALPSLGFFTVIGLGLAFPYLLLGIFPSLLKLLPRPGVWMESFKQAMAFPMLGAAAYFTWVLLGLVSEDNGRDLLIGLVVIALAFWIYGRWSVISKPTPVRVRAVIFALVFFVFGIWWAHPQAAPAKGSTSVNAGEVVWKEWSPELVADLRRQKKPVYIDFTARWCATCQVNHRVYSDATLAQDFNKRGVTLLKADWTKPDPRIEKALDELGESAVPVNVLYVPGREKPIILPKTLTVSNVQAALAELGK
jgi:thiol:disulfide interchange protein